MKKYNFRIFITITAFLVGCILANFSSWIEENRNSTVINAQKNELGKTLTFETDSVNACGMDFSTGIAYRNIKASDGEDILLSIKYFDSEKLAQKWFEEKIAEADKVFESNNISSNETVIGKKVIFESHNKIYSIKYYYSLDGQDLSSVNIIQFPTFQHAKAYEKSEEGLVLEEIKTSDELFEMIEKENH